MKIDFLKLDLKLRNFHIKEILFLTLAIFCYRQFIAWFYGEVSVDPTVNFLSFIALTIGNVPLTISLVWINFVVIRTLNKHPYLERHVLWRMVVELAYLFLVAALSSVIVNILLIVDQGLGVVFERPVFIEQFLSVLAFDTAIYYLLNVAFYFKKIHHAELTEQINKRNRVNYQYSLLKQQLNPHFLFNSLNVLDQLVKTDPNRASMFISKLADVYRYQLNQERKESVPLVMEIKFVEAYINLLQERFGDAIEATIAIDVTEMENNRIIPCALQLLVENAVKHNVVSDTKQLKIKIFTHDRWIVVKNNINPKFTKSESWGIGLQSIKEQYKTVFEEEIEILSKPTSFSVALPLIEM